MASELNLDIRSDGYVRVSELLKLNITTNAKVPLRSHSVEEIREVNLDRFCFNNPFCYSHVWIFVSQYF